MKATVQIFLSYAREDEEKVKNLYQRLSDAGFKPWMDKKDILPGERWKSSIQTAIRRSDFFLACLSAESVGKRGFLQREIKDALDIWQEKLDDDIYLIPVRLEDCEVPEGLCDFQWVNPFEEDGWTRLLEAIQVGIERRGEIIEPVVQESIPSKIHSPREKPSPGTKIVPPEEGLERVPALKHRAWKKLSDQWKLVSAVGFVLVVTGFLIALGWTRGLGPAGPLFWTETPTATPTTTPTPTYTPTDTLTPTYTLTATPTRTPRTTPTNTPTPPSPTVTPRPRPTTAATPTLPTDTPEPPPPPTQPPTSPPPPTKVIPTPKS